MQEAVPTKETWQPILSRYRQSHKAMKQIYQDILKTFTDVVESKVLGDGVTIETLISPSERDAMERCLIVKPTIAFIGQVNAGKSSLANELIGGGTWLPVAPEPCTSRMVRLKYNRELFKQKIPFHGQPEKKKMLKGNRPTEEDIRLSDKEKKDPKVFEVEVLFGVPNPHLYPDLEIIDLPGWSEKETLNTAIREAVEKMASPVLLPVYVLDGNLTVTAVDRQLIELLTKTFTGNKLLFVCNKIDHVDEKLHLDYGADGTLDVNADGSAVYRVAGRENKLVNKAEETFESLKYFGFVHDSETDHHSSNFYAVSAKMSKASRTLATEDPTQLQFGYYDQQYEDFRSHLNSRLDTILMRHVLGMIRTANTVVCRFAEGALTTRAAELSADLRVYAILKEAGEAEQRAYTKCVDFLSKESKAIEDAVMDSFSKAQPTILKNARKIAAKDLVTKSDCPLPLAFLITIAKMASRVLHHEITSRIDDVKEKYVRAFSLFTEVVVGSCDVILSDIFRSIFQPTNNTDVIKMVGNVESSDKAVGAGLGLFFLIPEAVGSAINEIFPDNPVSPKMATQLTGAALKMVKLDEKWKESIAQEFLAGIEVKELAPAILKYCRQKLEERHAQYVESHKQMIALREAKSSRSQEDNERLRVHFAPRIALLLLRLYAMQCALDKGEAEQGEQIGQGHHYIVSTCPYWGGPTTPNSLVLKSFIPLSQDLWGKVARSFYALRTLQGKEETEKYVVKLYGALISSLGGKEEEQRLTLVMERRAMTLPEALRRGLSRDERKLIAYDVAEAFSFLQGQGIPHGNFTAESISLDSQNRAKLDAMKLRPSGKDSWLGCSAYHQAPEVILDKNARNPATDVYSFGVLLWEIFNESLQPPACYSDCTTKEDIKKRVCEEGLRPSKPDHLADEWYGIMEECWKEPEDRPSMEDLATKIKDLVFSNQEEEGYSSS